MAIIEHPYSGALRVVDAESGQDQAEKLAQW